MVTGPEERTAEMPAEAVKEDEAARSPLGSASGEPPRLADGVQLLGQYEGSGFKDPPYIVRRADGQMVQLPPLLYMVAEGVDGERGFAEIAARVSERLGRGVSEQDVSYLAEKKLRPLGLLAGSDGSNPELKQPDLLLGLKLRAAIIPPSAVRAVATIFHPLFVTLVVLTVLGGLLALDTWLFFGHGMAQSVRETLYQPVLLLMIFGLVVVSAAFHEIGHATACKYGGARPGVMGAGIYIVWPAFYTDVTDAYRLRKGGRVRTDLGGVYFNMIFALVTAGVYFATGYEPLLVLVLMQHLLMFYQFMPFLRLDGYYVISDLTGVPDLFARVKPTLRSLLPWKKTSTEVAALKTWVRVVVTVWVLTVVPLLLYGLAMMVISAPRVLATTFDYALIQWDKVRSALGQPDFAAATAGSLQMTMLVLPVAGMSVTFTRVVKRLVSVGVRSSQGRPALRSILLAALVVAVGACAWILLPNGEYRPIQPGERGTVQESLRAVTQISTGRPGLSEDRQRELGGAPFSNKSAGGSGEALLDDSPVSEPGEPGTVDTGSGETSTEPEVATTPSPTPTPEVSPTPTPEESPEATPSPTPTEEPE
jgi:putative peptide zinc metalloprotease protein